MLRALVLGLSGALAVLLALEVVFRVLPVSTATLSGYHVDPNVLGYPPGHTWRMATGWDLRNPQTLRANSLGFASPQEFKPAPNAVALIGDSFVEASMLDEADRPAPQLQRALGGAVPVFGMGGPGSALLDYAERIRFASKRLGVRRFVVFMEAGDVRQSLCGSGNVHAACLDRTALVPRLQHQPAPSAAKRLIRHSALAQYVFSQLKVDAGRLWRQALASSAPPIAPHDAPVNAPSATASPPPAPVREAMVKAVVDRFFERIAPHAVDRLVFVVDGRRSKAALAAPREAAGEVLRERDRFIELARARGATIVDAEDLYRTHWVTSSRSLEVGPYDAHLNRLGIDLLMRAAAKALP
jgi:hypothetical protein